MATITPATVAATLDPDHHGRGLTDAAIDPGRYDGQSDDPLEVAGMLRAMMPPRARVLDVGCGTGSVTLIANRDRGNEVIAIEPDITRAAIARSRGLAVHGGVLDDAFIAAHPPFDVVMSSDVIEHTPAPAELLKMMVRATKPGGLILLSVPNVAHWTVRLNLLVGRFDYDKVGIMDATHLRWFTEKTFRSLLEQQQLDILALSQTVGYTLPSYTRGLMRHVPRRVRNRLVRYGTRVLPLLFGIQHVAKVRTPG